MLIRELKINLKSFLIWTSILVLLYVLVFAIYPSIISKNAAIGDLIQSMPKEILSIFNMDVASINHVSGWLLTEGYLFVTLLGSCFFAILGGTILLKEHSDHTIDFLYSKPLYKRKIVSSKLLTGIIYVIIFNIIISITTFIGLKLSHDFTFIEWLLMSVAPIFVHLLFFLISLFVSIYFRKTNRGITAGLGMVLGTYFLGVISMMADSLEFLKYISPFEYINSRTIVQSQSLNILNLSVLSIFMIISVVSLYQMYRRKEVGI